MGTLKFALDVAMKRNVSKINGVTRFYWDWIGPSFDRERLTIVSII